MGDKEGNVEQHNSEEFLLAEYRRFADSFWRNEEVGEKRVNFFITLVTAVITAMVALATTTKQGILATLVELFIDKQGTLDQYQIAVLVLLALLSFGVVTLLRIIHRNRVTDEYKRGMDTIRDCFRNWEKQRLQDYQPFETSFKITEQSLEKLRSKVPDNVLKKLKCIKNQKFTGVEKFVDTLRTKIGEKQPVDFLLILKHVSLDESKPRKPGTGGLAEMVALINSIIVAALIVLFSRSNSTWGIGWRALVGFILSLIGHEFCIYLIHKLHIYFSRKRLKKQVKSNEIKSQAT